MRTLYAAALLLVATPQAPPPIPARPEALAFKPISYTPPRAEDFRVVLKNGMVVYIAEDKTLPLVTVALRMRLGSYVEPKGKEGLADFVGSQMRRGGTEAMAAEALDERLDFLATQVGTHIGETSGFARLNCLRDNLAESLRLFVGVLKTPRFEQSRLDLAKEAAIQEMRKRNDDASKIESREWRVLLLGDSHFANRFETEASIHSISRDDLLAFHRAYVNPANMVAAVSGAFDRAEMIASLEAAFAGWPAGSATLPPVPSAIEPSAPGLYRIQKEVNQGRVSIGLPTVKRDSPDVYALEVMNEILGGSGFTSRITRTVRSNEGLAYEAGSSIDFGIYYPGSFRAVFQSKSESVAYATELVLSEVRRIREERVTPAELDTIKKSLIETFPSYFSTTEKTMELFASEEFTNRSPEYFRTYRERIGAVTAADVSRVAAKYLDPDKMIALVVGDQHAIDKADPRHPVSLKGLFGGKETNLPLRDPLTMKRP